MTGGWRANWKGDVAGGVTSAVLTIPVSMGYGLLAVYPLGHQYASFGILAGLYCAIFVPVTAVLLGANTPMVYAPRSVVSFLLSSIVLHSLIRSRESLVDAADLRHTMTVVLFVVFLAGLFQAMLGALRLGSLIQYVPSPVMAGFQNAAAVLILLSQLDSLLGFREHVPPFLIAEHLGAAQPLTLLVGVVTAVGMWYAGSLSRKIPPAIIGLAAGGGVYYLIKTLGFGESLGPVIGSMPPGMPNPSYLLGFVSLTSTPTLWRQLPSLATAALSLAIIASLDGLLCAKTLEGATGQKMRGNGELLRLGIGNMVSACFGGISGGINMASSFANYRSGGRTALSGLAGALVILVAVLVLPPVIAIIPRVVIAGLLLVAAIQLFDVWSIHMVRRMLRREFVQWKSMALDLFVVALVATVAIAINLVAAVGIGVAITIVSFLFRMSKSAVRRAYRGDVVHSRKTRDPLQMEVLQKHGATILVLELEGPIFFGTAEQLATRVEGALREGIRYVVLDLKRVNEIDSTGARILLQIHDRLRKEDKHLLVSHATRSRRVADFLRDMRVLSSLTTQRIFDDTDRALEWAEERLIASELDGVVARGDDYPLEQIEVLAGLAPHEVDALRGLLVRKTYGQGEAVIREGETGREMFIIVRGAASVKIKLPGDGRENRLATFSAGTVFGEMALLDRQPRSATVEADEDLVCYVLTEDAFGALTREHGPVAIKVLTNVGRELSRRLRGASRTIYELES
jgi:sulfate permease, SulP family